VWEERSVGLKRALLAECGTAFFLRRLLAERVGAPLCHRKLRPPGGSLPQACASVWVGATPEARVGTTFDGLKALAMEPVRLAFHGVLWWLCS